MSHPPSQTICSCTNGHHSAEPRILIVDDEPAILFAYRKLIEREGIEVDLCECLDAAIERIRTCRYLAIIADMRLAGTDNTDGMEVLRVIRKEQPDTKVILSTGYGNKEVEQTAHEMGVSYYFEKPVVPSVLLAALRSLKSIAGAHAEHAEKTG